MEIVAKSTIDLARNATSTVVWCMIHHTTANVLFTPQGARQERSVTTNSIMWYRVVSNYPAGSFLFFLCINSIPIETSLTVVSEVGIKTTQPVLKKLLCILYESVGLFNFYETHFLHCMCHHTPGKFPLQYTEAMGLLKWMNSCQTHTNKLSTWSYQRHISHSNTCTYCSLLILPSAKAWGWDQYQGNTTCMLVS